MTYLILGAVSVLVVLVVVLVVIAGADMYAALESDWDSEIAEGSCRGHCKHAVCPTPFQCHLGEKK